ncbi:hypothetical protein [Faecalispora jeddahensis]|uniref:hypothetical protein n=1 Tax=Faecalispora jeddahensis TaxID=1414721 RepID=UPI00189AB602|nr:hypothetical protein [Faecalispora jeddahensis]
MLGRLLKYEIKSTARIYLPLYLLLFLMAVINKVFISINSGSIDSGKFGIPIAISMTAYVTIVAAIIVITLVMTIQRFYKNLLQDEGYLMFTLPVSVDANILSKLLAAVLWNIASLVISFFSVLVLALDRDAMTAIVEGWRAIQAFLATQNAMVYGILFQSILLLLLSLAVGILNLYVAMAIGQLLTKHRVAGALGAFFLIGLVEQIIATVFINTAANSGWFDFFEAMQPVELTNWVLTALNIGLVVLGAIYYFATKYILKNKLNLE